MELNVLACAIMDINQLLISVFALLICINLTVNVFYIQIVRMELLGMVIVVSLFNAIQDLFGTELSAHQHL